MQAASTVILRAQNGEEHIQTLYHGRLCWSTVKEAFGGGFIEIVGRGAPGVFPSDHSNPELAGLTRGEPWTPGTVIEVIVGMKAMPGGLLTAKGAMGQPLAKLNHRISDRGSKSKTLASKPRTFDRIQAWPNFNEEAMALYESLDDTIPRFERQTYGSGVGPDGIPHLPAVGGEFSLQGFVHNVLLFVNAVALTVPGLDRMEFCDGGSNRSASFTDLLLRMRGVTDKRNLSKLIYAILEVKGNWQCDLNPQMSLQAVFEHREGMDEVIQALQQAYGDAVVDEAPILILTNYHVTYFLMRNFADVNDKALYASPPIPWNCTSLPPRAAWLYAMAVASKCMDNGVKDVLSRDDVPVTPPGGYSMQGLQVHANAAWAGGCATNPSRPRLPRDCKKSTSLKERALCYLELGFTPDCISASMDAKVFRGSCQGSDRIQALAIKVFNPESSTAVAAYCAEVAAYARLEGLQGRGIPVEHVHGELVHSGSPVLATHMVGQSLDRALSEAEYKNAQEVLNEVHGLGLSHGDIRDGNILLLEDGGVMLCDFGRSCLDASDAEKEEDNAALRRLLLDVSV